MANFRLFMVILLLFWLVPISTAQEPIILNDCWFTAIEDAVAYLDRSLVEPHLGAGMMPGGSSFRVQEVAGDAVLVMVDHAMSFWVEIAKGRFSGSQCEILDDYVAVEGTLLTDARIWSAPDVTAGEVLTSLPAGVNVAIIGSPAVGRIRYDSNVTDIWYPIRYIELTGWVWSGRLDTPEIALLNANAITLENARLWSLPDVERGLLLHTLPADTLVEVIGGPFTGLIRHDELTTGVWYQVQVDGIIGWIWENRLRFE
jgi:hypothetical protein